LYVSTAHSVVSGALVVKTEIKHKDKTAKQQFPVYFVLEVLMGSKKFYSEMKKICYVVIMSSRKLRHYFKAHTIRVLTNQALNDIFGNRGSFGRISKWAMELLEYFVNFEKHSAIKSHVLVDFMPEWMEPRSVIEGEVPETPWVIYCDGAWGATRTGAAVILLSPSGIKLHYAVRIQFNNESDKGTNNITGYEAIFLGLCKLRAIRV
jgi:hypothetical protein